MRRKWIAVLLAAPLMLAAAGEEEALKLRCVSSPNLVRNADFSQRNESGLPLEWVFDNCSKSPEFRTEIVQKNDGNILAVNSVWEKFGYWLQNVPVQEGKSYYVSCDVQSDAPNVALWLKYQATKKPEKKTQARLSHVFSRTLRYGDDMKSILRDFVDENLLITLSPVNWSRLDAEVVIPEDYGIGTCEFRVGVWGGNAGEARYRNPVFRESAARLEADISGKGWTSLTVKGANPEAVELDPEKDRQSVSVVLPKVLKVYEVKLSGRDGNGITREFVNE